MPDSTSPILAQDGSASPSDLRTTAITSVPWVLVAGGFHRCGGMDKANLALAEHLVGRGTCVHVVCHSVDAELAEHPKVTVHMVFVFVGESAVGLFGPACCSPVAESMAWCKSRGKWNQLSLAGHQLDSLYPSCMGVRSIAGAACLPNETESQPLPCPTAREVRSPYGARSHFQFQSNEPGSRELLGSRTLPSSHGVSWRGVGVGTRRAGRESRQPGGIEHSRRKFRGGVCRLAGFRS
jgi:hypothetical protein